MAPLSVQNATAAISCISVTAHEGTILCSWADNPSTRGTLNILWLCISTLGLCVWNAVHPDVPYPGTPQWRVVGKRVWWLFIGLFMPEMLVLAALGQFRQAYTLLIRVSRETRVTTEFPWWMKLIERLWPTYSIVNEILDHRPASLDRITPVPLPTLELEDMSMSTLLPLRAFRPSLPGPSPPSTDAMTRAACEGQENARKHPWTLTHSFYAVMHGFMTPDGDAFWTTQVDRDGDSHTGFDPEKGIKRIRAAPNDALRIPDLSAEDLDDRSKAGAIAKSLLVWQLSVFIANCAARWNQGLPISLLEITTLAHTLCALIALTLWWYKPHSANEVAVVDGARDVPLLPLVESWMTTLGRAGEKVTPGANAIDLVRAITILDIAVLYGLPHLLGLSIHFPTADEQLCWKIATYVVIGSPLGICFILWIMDIDLTEKLDCEAWNWMIGWLLVLLILIYPMASMFLVGESVRQVFTLPEGSFHEPRLTRYFPSFS